MVGLKLFSLVVFLFLADARSAVLTQGQTKRLGLFSGRISRINEEAGLIRLKIDFVNMKYLNKRDQLEFWDERGPDLKCKGYVIGKSNNYLLLKVPEFAYCKRFIYTAEGGYMMLFSQDLVNNLKMGKELLKILLKKRLALNSRLLKNQKNLDNHIEKVNSINLRYKVLRDKLEAEWREELGSLEEDRLTSYRNYKDLEGRILDIDNKLEKYRIDDKNLKDDRWALDPRLYFPK